jgi:hypothetical protein
MEKVEHKFFDSDIETSFISPIVKDVIEIDFNELVDAVVLSIDDLEALAKAMGKKLVDDVGVHDVEEYYKDE